MKIEIKKAFGKVTEEAIVNKRGGVLLPEGVELTQPIILALIKQGITHATVEEEEESQADINENQYKEYLYLLFNRFNGPLMKELKECLLKLNQPTQ